MKKDLILTPDQVCAQMIDAELTQAELCQKAHIAPSTFTRWRAGKTSITVDTYVCILCIIEEAKAQVARRRRRLRHQISKYRASLGAEHREMAG